MKKIKARHIVALAVLAALLIFVGAALDNRLQITNDDVFAARVPAEFDGYKIAQLSDLHSLWFGDHQQDLISAVQSGNPDIIVLTGDIIDVRILDYDSVTTLFEGLTKIAPVYAVSGNHENESTAIEKRMDELYMETGICHLKDAGTKLEKNGAVVWLYGLDVREKIDQAISVADTKTYSILLYHLGNQFDQVKNPGYNLIFSGHTHGGLIRLPFVGGIVSPDWELDFNQKYTGGMYALGDTTLIVNRGLAGSHSIPRIFNRPEVVFVTLHHEQ